jgi:hypothetical protein
MNRHGCSCSGSNFRLPSLLVLVLRRPKRKSGIVTDTIARCSMVPYHLTRLFPMCLRVSSYAAYLLPGSGSDLGLAVL